AGAAGTLRATGAGAAGALRAARAGAAGALRAARAGAAGALRAARAGATRAARPAVLRARGTGLTVIAAVIAAYAARFGLHGADFFGVSIVAASARARKHDERGEERCWDSPNERMSHEKTSRVERPHRIRLSEIRT